MATSYNSDMTLASGLRITAAMPVDVRMVVDTVNDLTTIPSAYAGLIVNIKGSSDLYVLKVGGMGAKKLENWLKVGGSNVNPEQISTQILDSVNDLTDESKVTFAYKGMMVYVKDDPETSEDESGLYILTDTPVTDPSNWTKIVAGTNIQTGTEHVITTDGTIPTSQSGISISKEGSTDIEEVYVDDDEIGFLANTYYTSRGLNSDLTNDGDSDQTLGDVDYIILTGDTNGSYIRLYSNDAKYSKWMEIHFADADDNSLGFTQEMFKAIDADGNELEFDENNTLSVSKENEYICFTKNVKFGGLTERHVKDGSDNGEEYVFGTTGSKYFDLDIYSENVLPKVVAYSEGTPVQILTVADKEEIITMITETIEPDTITDVEILGLFND